MRLLLITLITGLMASPKTALADYGNETPFPWMTTSARGRFLFKMVPPPWRGSGDEPVIDRPPFGVAYQLTEDGEFKELWHAEGWYGYRGKLSDDGRYLVVFGPWASDQKEHTDLAIAFYDKGKLLKQYAVRDLIREHDAVENSVSHYSWTPERQTKPNGFYQDRFHLVTIEKTAYDFDYTTGEISSRTRDEGAKNYMEIRNEEEAEFERKGLEVLEANSFKKDYESYFEISEASAPNWTESTCSLEGPIWTARLVPRKTFDHPVSVSPMFPLRDGKLGVSLSPQEMVSAIEKALKNPYVEKQLKIEGATDLDLRTQGDRLHWDTPELADHLKQVTGKTPDEGALAQWAYFVINSGMTRCVSIYFNTKDGSILAEDPSEQPLPPDPMWLPERTPYMIDPAGNRLAPSPPEIQGDPRSD